MCAGDHDAESLELAFSKKKIEERKNWLQNFSEGTFLDQSAEEISYSDFVDKVALQAQDRHTYPPLHPQMQMTILCYSTRIRQRHLQ